MRLLFVALACLLVPALAGCSSCEPLVDVRHREEVPAGIQTREWTSDDRAAWPDVDAVMAGTSDDGHDHIHWNHTREVAFWEYLGMDPSAPEREVWLDRDGEVFRIRVLTCTAI